MRMAHQAGHPTAPSKHLSFKRTSKSSRSRMTLAESKSSETTVAQPKSECAPFHAFPCSTVQEIAHRVLQNESESLCDARLGRTILSADQQQMALNISERIKRDVKDLIYKQGNARYKVVVYVMVGDDVNTDILCASRFMWNKTTDNYVEATLRNDNIYAVAVVFGVYFE